MSFPMFSRLRQVIQKMGNIFEEMESHLVNGRPIQNMGNQEGVVGETLHHFPPMSPLVDLL